VIKEYPKLVEFQDPDFINAVDGAYAIGSAFSRSKCKDDCSCGMKGSEGGFLMAYPNHTLEISDAVSYDFDTIHRSIIWDKFPNDTVM